MKKLSHTPEKAIRESAPGASNSLRSGLMIICGLLAFLLYANTLNHEYVLDDETAIVKNAFTQEGVSALPKIFSSSYRAGFDERKEGLYRPLSVALFAIEWEVAPGNPHLGHWINVLLYVLTAMILFITLSLFFANKNLLLPFVTTLLFVAHPIHTEVVANIKSSDEILCFLFSIISLWAVIKYARENRTLYLFISGITIFAGMLSKETAVTMVAVAPLTVYFFSNAGTKKLLIAAVPFIAAFVLYMAIRISVLKGMTGFEEIQIINNSLVAAGDDTTSRVATAIFILGRYLWLLIFPTPLCFDYSYNTIPLTSFGDPKTLLSLVTILALTIIAVRGWKSKSPVAWGLIFMGATLLLVSNLFFLIEATLAERFLYMPSLGFCSAITL
ncbi:MAG TPA: DUF1736 domain-containing protein, partial [Chitinophagales bacterium]|nr:DUF1736 domain-containing protein [Chitinophagales bacterium]